MPNPRITFRVPVEIYDQLPQDADQRSLFCLQAIKDKLHPPTPEDELSQLRRRVERIEKEFGL